MNLASLMDFGALSTILSASGGDLWHSHSCLKMQLGTKKREMGSWLDSGNPRSELVPAQQPMERGCY